MTFKAEWLCLSLFIALLAAQSFNSHPFLSNAANDMPGFFVYAVCAGICFVLAIDDDGDEPPPAYR